MSETASKPVPPDPGFDAPPTDAERTGRTVRAHLALFTVALVLPALLFTAFMLGQFAATERKRLESEASDIAHTVAVAVDRDLTGLFASLDVLSTSAHLQNGDFAGFYNQAAELLRRQGIVTLLTDTTGQQLVNLRLPWGSPLPKTHVNWDVPALTPGRPVVTDLIVGQVTGIQQFLAVASVDRNGAPAYYLLFSVPVERLQRIIREAEIPPSYTVSIVDRKGLIMARSTRAEEFVGRPATDDLQRNTAGRQGTWSGSTIDGTPVFGAYARSSLSDFRVAAGIRFSDLKTPLWRSLGLFGLLFSALVALSLLLALVVGKRITEPMRSLAAQAARLGRGAPVTPLSSGLAEADAVSRELAAASASLREREADLREANNEIQRFAYIVSHDLRSPLVNIMGFTTELETLRQDVFERVQELRAAVGAPETAKDGELDRDFTEAIGFIKASISKMDRLINAILRLSREGRRDFRPERVDMEALVASIQASLAHQADRAGATVTAGRLPALISDRLALEQIFSNLVDNALKYLRAGVPGRIEISGRANGAMVVYEVRDNGRGIDPNDVGRVFDLFRRSGVQDRPGEGIGLAHVRTLVRRLGGTIGLTSVLGRGSTFTVSLPRRWIGEKQGKAA
ncbi:sensor histidine kinase [Enterovirga sp.]|uniref:sensor histidine kinase n=1 Tax=Enterovirga sp. TaxID=2026350 RepID=UPI00261C4454|nr:sensor histidine kinase [Enterovirga sp.]